MYKTELIRRVAKDTRLSQRIVSDVLQSSQTAIRDALSRGQEVQLPGFGTFYTRQRKESSTIHLRTKQKIHVPSMRIAGFRVGEVLRRAVRRSGKARKQRTILGSVLGRAS